MRQGLTARLLDTNAASSTGAHDRIEIRHWAPPVIGSGAPQCPRQPGSKLNHHAVFGKFVARPIHVRPRIEHLLAHMSQQDTLR